MNETSKYIETKFHLVPDKREDGTISIHYVPSDKMKANIFKKSFTRIEGGNIQDSFDGNRFYIICCSSRSRDVRVWIKLKTLT